MEEDEVAELAKALSEKTRVDLLRALSDGRVRSYSTLMRRLGLDPLVDSGKFAYHVGVATGAGLLEKVDDGYQITAVGRETLSAMQQTTRRQQLFRLVDAAAKLTAGEVAALTWFMPLLLFAAPLGVFWGLILTALRPGASPIGALLLLASIACCFPGLLCAVRLRAKVGGSLRDAILSLEGCAQRLGEGNAGIVSLIAALVSLSVMDLQITAILTELGVLAGGPVSYALLLMGGLLFAAALLVTRKMLAAWEATSSGKPAMDLRSLTARGHRVIIAGLLLVGGLIAAYALFSNTISWSVKAGYLGSAVGLFGAALGVWAGFRSIDRRRVWAR